MSSNYTTIIFDSATLAMKARELLTKKGLHCELVGIRTASGCGRGLKVSSDYLRYAQTELTLAGIPHYPG